MRLNLIARSRERQANHREHASTQLTTKVKDMPKKILTIACLWLFPLPAVLLAETSLDARLQRTEQRIQELEERSQDRQSESGNWFERLEFTGVIEVEAAWEDPDNGDSQSSTTLATAELGIAARIASAVSAELVLLYEDDGAEDLDVDVAAITLAPGDAWSLRAGQFYLPFGVYETQMISDPLTLELGEIRETALQADFNIGILSVSGYLFDGDASEDGNGKIDNFGVDLSLTQEFERFSFSADLGYLNDIGDSDGLIAHAGPVHQRVAGYAFSASVTSGPFTLIGEYLAAKDSFASGIEPSAYNLEAGYGFQLAGLEANAAFGVQGTDEADPLGLPESMVIAALSMGIYENTVLAFEFAESEDYANNKTNRFSVQLAAEF
jgi:hypothetical protein